MKKLKPRRPQEADALIAEAHQPSVAALSSAQPAGGIAGQPAGRRVFPRQNGLVVRKKTFYIPNELCISLGEYALHNGLDEKDVVVVSLKRFLGKE